MLLICLRNGKTWIAANISVGQTYTCVVTLTLADANVSSP